MIITILPQKYDCDCNKGITIESTPNLVKKLNKIIQWDKVTWPEKEEGKPDKEFLGIQPNLKPGDMLLWDGNILAIKDENSVVLIVTETGPYSVKRFVELVNNENSIETLNNNSTELVVEELDWDNNPPQNYIELRVGYSKYRIFKEGCNNPEILKKNKLKIKNTSLPIILPTTLYVDGQGIKYNPEEINSNTILDVALLLYNWIIKKKKGN